MLDIKVLKAFLNLLSFALEILCLILSFFFPPGLLPRLLKFDLGIFFTLPQCVVPLSFILIIQNLVGIRDVLELLESMSAPTLVRVVELGQPEERVLNF